jgi:2-succinyl-5-enolpyruvyl-6-hydroxy-3-cyclohexene-1-carboxylate synthase
MKTSALNMNALWAELLVEELVRQGVTHFCVAPGSRSTPLALAVGAHRRARSTVHFDERALAFFALGTARATGRPAAVITTSGTAAANLLPAVAEASRDGVPLLVLTADRPPELRDANANQTIDQVKLFGGFVRWFVDMPCPDVQVPPAYVLTTAGQAVLASVQPRPGPVHLNCMFREPLAPVPDGVDLKAYAKPLARWMAGREPYTAFAPTYAVPTVERLKDVARLMDKARRGLIVVGPLDVPPGPVLALAQKKGWPVLPDVQSGLRFGLHQRHVITHADAIAASDRFCQRHKPDLVLHFGGRPTSKRVAQFVAGCGARQHVVIDHGAERADAAHRATLRVAGHISYVAAVLASFTKRARAGAWLGAWTKANALARDILSDSDKELSEPFAASAVSELTPEDHGLFLGSSMPVRDMDLAASGKAKAHAVAANRGASGIDGTVATAAGFAAGLGQPATVVLGDLALLYDLNALALVRTSKQPVTVVVINNDGGGIFSFLPVAAGRSPDFERFFGTPHGLVFKDAAAMFGLPYVCPERPASFRKAYAAAVASGRSSIIEVKTSRAENRELHARILARVARAVGRIG